MYTRVYLQDEEGSTMESCLHDMLNDMSREARQILQGMRSMDEPADCVTAGEILAALALQHLTGSVEREAEDGRQDDLSDQSDFHEDVCERVAANLTETLVYWLNDHHNIRRIKDIVSRMASRSEEITKPSYIGQFEQTIIEDMEQLASEFGLSVDPGQLPTHSTAAQDLILRYIREGREGSTLQAIAVQELKNLGILQEQEPAEEQAQIWKDYDVPNQDEQEPQVEGLVSHPVTPGMLHIAINKLTGYWPGVEADKKRINEMDEDDRKQAWQYVLNFNLQGLMDYNILRIPDTYSTEYLLGPDGLETMHLLANPRSRKSQDGLIWMLKAKIDDRYDNFIHLNSAVRNLSRDGYFRAWCAVHFDDPDTLRQLGVIKDIGFMNKLKEQVNEAQPNCDDWLADGLEHEVTPDMLETAINVLVAGWPGASAYRKGINQLDENERNQAWMYILNDNVHGLFEYGVLGVPESWGDPDRWDSELSDGLNYQTDPEHQHVQEQLIRQIDDWLLANDYPYVCDKQMVRHINRDEFFRVKCAMRMNDFDTLCQLGVVTEPDEASEQKTDDKAPAAQITADDIIEHLVLMISRRCPGLICNTGKIKAMDSGSLKEVHDLLQIGDLNTLYKQGVLMDVSNGSDENPESGKTSQGETQRSDVDSPTVAQTMKSLNMWLSRMRSELTANPDAIREMSVQERNSLLAIGEPLDPVRLYKQGILIDQDQQGKAAGLTSPRSNENLSRSIYYLLMKYRPESELNEGVLIQQTDEQRRKIEQWLALGKLGLDYMEQHGIIRAPDETDKELDSGNPPSET